MQGQLATAAHYFTYVFTGTCEALAVMHGCLEEAGL
jgi:hypothetical protein